MELCSLISLGRYQRKQLNLTIVEVQRYFKIFLCLFWDFDLVNHCKGTQMWKRASSRKIKFHSVIFTVSYRFYLLPYEFWILSACVLLLPSLWALLRSHHLFCSSKSFFLIFQEYMVSHVLVLGFIVLKQFLKWTFVYISKNMFTNNHSVGPLPGWLCVL